MVNTPFFVCSFTDSTHPALTFQHFSKTLRRQTILPLALVGLLVGMDVLPIFFSAGGLILVGTYFTLVFQPVFCAPIKCELPARLGGFTDVAGLHGFLQKYIIVAITTNRTKISSGFIVAHRADEEW